MFRRDIAPPCFMCRIVDTFIRWKYVEEAAWKRPVVLLLSLLLGIGFPLMFQDVGLLADPEPLVYICLPFIVALSFAGLLVSLFGCNKCVAKMYGDF